MYTEVLGDDMPDTRMEDPTRKRGNRTPHKSGAEHRADPDAQEAEEQDGMSPLRQPVLKKLRVRSPGDANVLQNTGESGTEDSDAPPTQKYTEEGEIVADERTEESNAEWGYTDDSDEATDQETEVVLNLVEARSGTPPRRAVRQMKVRKPTNPRRGRGKDKQKRKPRNDKGKPRARTRSPKGSKPPKKHPKVRVTTRSQTPRKEPSQQSQALGRMAARQ